MSCNSDNRRRAIRRASALAGLCALAGCAQPPMRVGQLLPTEQYGITVTSAPEQIALGVHPSGLSGPQEAALGQFVSRWREDGGGPVTLRAPLGGDGRLSRRMQDAVAAGLVRLGVPQERVVLVGYAPPAPNAPVIASYDRFVAQGSNCSGGWSNLTSTGANRPSNHFGCAVTSNIAVQVANPRDFLAPAVETPADNSRRAFVLGKYRQGLITSSAKDDQANGKVSDTASGN